MDERDVQERGIVMTDRERVLSIMKSWMGAKQGDAKHKHIVDAYNEIRPLPVGYKVTYTDAWCAATVSAAFHEAGLDSIFPSECSCTRMIEKAKQLGVWVEDDSFVPRPADALIYDWEDNGVGDCKGTPNHVGIVREVSGGYIYVIEGNYSKQCKERKLKVNGKYIRGFVTPKFVEEKKELAPMTKGIVDTAIVWDFLLDKGLNEYGAAGLMGNLRAESAFKPTNLQNSYEKKLDLLDEEYTQCVDTGLYTNFAKDSAGYGLAQWTYHTRKKALKEYADSVGASIGNLQMQLEFLYKELSTSYKGVLKVLKNAKSIQEASDIVLTQFEKPADQSVSVKAKRAEYAFEYYWLHSCHMQNEGPRANESDSVYVVGKVYTLQANMFVRDAANGNKKQFSQLTPDGKKHGVMQKDGSGVLKTGTAVTCQSTQTLSDGSIWMKVPSGWVCAWSADGKVYIK